MDWSRVIAGVGNDLATVVDPVCGSEDRSGQPRHDERIQVVHDAARNKERVLVGVAGSGGEPRQQCDDAERVYPSVAIALRKELGFYAAVRPIRNFAGVSSRYENVDFIIYRENSEDLYIGSERMVDDDTAEAIKRITRGASAQIARFAFEDMRKRTHSSRLFLNLAAELAEPLDPA
jgi:isocitrate/isopropylmalate dehydrogenase